MRLPLLLLRQISEPILCPGTVEELKRRLQEASTAELLHGQAERALLASRIADQRWRISIAMDTIAAAKERGEGTDAL